MQGAPRRQVNAEDMLAELKRALESSTHTPDAPPPSASTAPKPSLPGRATGRSQIDNGSGRPAKANTDKSTRPRTELQRSTRPNSRSWKLIAGGLALAVAATIGVSFAFMGKPSNLPEPEPTVAATGARPDRKTNKLLSPQAPPERRCRTASRLRLCKPETWGRGRTPAPLPSSAVRFQLGEKRKSTRRILPPPA